MPSVLSTVTLCLAAALLLSSLPAQAQRGERGERVERGDRADRGQRTERGQRDQGARQDRRSEAPSRQGHAKRPITVVVQPGPRYVAPRAAWAGQPRGVGYWGSGYRPGNTHRYDNHVYYKHRPYVRGPALRPISPYYPRFGVVIRHRPAVWTWITVGALAYLYADGVYYREHRSGGYEVVAPPADTAIATTQPQLAEAFFVYPRDGQSAQQQASDEFECHSWAVRQTGFDPSSVAAGTAGDPSVEQLSGYPRARNACLDGRGYTVR